MLIVVKKAKKAKKAKKQKNARKTDKTNDASKKTARKTDSNNGSSKKTKTKTTEQHIKSLIEKGEKKGFLTYDEMNKALPEEAVSPTRLDHLLATLDEMGVDLLDEASFRKQQEEEEFEEEETQVKLDHDEAAGENQLVVDKMLEKQLLEPEATRRIDDPIRMYLTQMGQIPLLNRKAEITLARKIEIARMDFRRKLLQCDYCARNALD